MTHQHFAVFAWRGDGLYNLRDAVGARIWKREHAAQKFCDEQNADSRALVVNPRGYVVRSSAWYRDEGDVEVTKAGRTYMRSPMPQA